MQKILVLGAKGMLGRQLMEVFGNGAVGWDREDADVTDAQNLRLKVENLSPAVIINCVAYNNVDSAEQHRDLAFLLNGQVPENLAKLCRDLGLILVHFSTNYVFDGQKGEYEENDLPRPLSVYGQSKLQGEQAVVGGRQKYYLIRTSVLFGPAGQSSASKQSFPGLMLDLSAKTDNIKVVNNEINSLTYSVDLAKAVKGLVEQQKPFGLYHITNSGQASWYDFAKEVFGVMGKNIKLEPVSSAEFPRSAKRPGKTVLLNTKLPPLRPWQEALREYLNQEV